MNAVLLAFSLMTAARFVADLSDSWEWPKTLVADKSPIGL